MAPALQLRGYLCSTGEFMHIVALFDMYGNGCQVCIFGLVTDRFDACNGRLPSTAVFNISVSLQFSFLCK